MLHSPEAQLQQNQQLEEHQQLDQLLQGLSINTGAKGSCIGRSEQGPTRCHAVTAPRAKNMLADNDRTEQDEQTQQPGSTGLDTWDATMELDWSKAKICANLRDIVSPTRLAPNLVSSGNADGEVEDEMQVGEGQLSMQQNHEHGDLNDLMEDDEASDPMFSSDGLDKFGGHSRQYAWCSCDPPCGQYGSPSYSPRCDSPWPAFCPTSPDYSPHYSPKSPSHSPFSPAYSPTSPLHPPTSPAYSPTSPTYHYQRSPAYPPHRSTYSPNSPAYSPTSPAYSPTGSAYSPNSPAYSPTRPAYLPNIPAYSPNIPAYSPTGPAYSPNIPAYKPNIAAYTPTGPAYSPSIPAYSPTGPAYSPRFPGYCPNSPAFSPMSLAYKPELPDYSQMSPAYSPTHQYCPTNVPSSARAWPEYCSSLAPLPPSLPFDTPKTISALTYNSAPAEEDFSGSPKAGKILGVPQNTLDHKDARYMPLRAQLSTGAMQSDISASPLSATTASEPSYQYARTEAWEKQEDMQELEQLFKDTNLQASTTVPGDQVAHSSLSSIKNLTPSTPSALKRTHDVAELLESFHLTSDTPDTPEQTTTSKAWKRHTSFKTPIPAAGPKVDIGDT